MSVEYVCVDIVESQGVYDCKKWVVHQNQPVLTKAQVDEIGGVLVLFFAALVCYLMTTKAIKIA